MKNTTLICNGMKARVEAFGGIIMSRCPPALAWVDKDYMRSLGCKDHPIWKTSFSGVLNAPQEVHLELTSLCNYRCRGCYTASGPEGSKSLSWKQAEAAVRLLASMGVFHIALGGGESFMWPRLFDLAELISELGMIPNITTNGYWIRDADVARRCRVFGAAHVSMDGLREIYRKSRGHDGFDAALTALRFLRDEGCRTGVNVTLSRHNADRMNELFAFLIDEGIHNVELLRYKPSGRATDDYEEHGMSQSQLNGLAEQIERWTHIKGLSLRLDCSLTPFLASAGWPVENMRKFGWSGCDAGNMLASVDPSGHVHACSFDRQGTWTVDELERRWEEDPVFTVHRKWTDNAPEPCASCKYLDICRGGCHAVARAISKDVNQPDPQCPMVRNYRETNGKKK